MNLYSCIYIYIYIYIIYVYTYMYIYYNYKTVICYSNEVNILDSHEQRFIIHT